MTEANMKQGKRHTLLAFRRRYHNRRGLYFFVAFLFFAFYLALNLMPASFWERIPWKPDYDWILLVAGAVVFVAAVFRLVASEIPYVQCTAHNLKIQTPLYPIVISYKRMKETRPNPLFQVFRRDKLSRVERGLVLDDKVSGQTAVVINMLSWPMRLTYLKFWLSNLMVTSDNRGLVLWVEDWMTLNRELGDFKDRWRDRKTGRVGGPSASRYGQIMRDK
jgi:hypothetical protein